MGGAVLAAGVSARNAGLFVALNVGLFAALNVGLFAALLSPTYVRPTSDLRLSCGYDVGWFNRSTFPLE
jgi:hypothetical protein